MKRACTILLFLTISSAFGQQVVIRKTISDGHELEVVAHGPPYFEFNEYDTTLTTVAREYLDDFGKDYKDNMLSERKYLIELTPGFTEREKDKSLGVKRLKVIVQYLKIKYAIDESEFRLRYTEQVATKGCVGFVIKEKHSRKITRREKRRLRKEENNYFEIR